MRRRQSVRQPIGVTAAAPYSAAAATTLVPGLAGRAHEQGVRLSGVTGEQCVIGVGDERGPVRGSATCHRGGLGDVARDRDNRLLDLRAAHPDPSSAASAEPSSRSTFALSFRAAS
jgi:hypothetical protein